MLGKRDKWFDTDITFILLLSKSYLYFTIKSPFPAVKRPNPIQSWKWLDLDSFQHLSHLVDWGGRRSPIRHFRRGKIFNFLASPRRLLNENFRNLSKYHLFQIFKIFQIFLTQRLLGRVAAWSLRRVCPGSKFPRHKTVLKWKKKYIRLNSIELIVHIHRN